MLTDFHGGMIIYFFSYSVLIIPIVFLAFASFIETVISSIRKGIKPNRIKIIAHSILILTIIAYNVYESELFSSKGVLVATLKDDLFRYTLIFKENGNCEHKIDGMLGYKENIKGKYRFIGDTIVFDIKPYTNNFLPDTLLINRNQGAIFISKDKDGNFSNKKEWLNHFEIRE
ncbi:hypothetical protein H8B06_02020 [Sphingobacterium sp. DN00404]|uniref:Uncharacterized protein n=1 Tax=Sphingobacterium micropteri TaxID=2763501 RepID=A0ABR7YJW3_9SPHI|nr:hypothetical protein [Sphingobacterium micropteri]